MSFYAQYPVTGGGGVPIYPNLAAFPASATTGALGVAADTGNVYEFNGTSWQLVGGPGVALGVGTFDSGTPSANGAHINGSSLIMQSASVSNPGEVNTTTQSFAGNKTFTGSISASNLSGTNTGDVTIGTASGLSLASQVLSLALSNTSTTGALSSTDWNTFNNKQSALTFGNLTDAGTDGITITNGTGSVIGTGTSIAQQKSDATHNGYLASADFTVFNAKQPAGNYITALTGDVVATGPGSVASTIQPNVVSNSKLAQMNTLTIKGNNTGGSANALDLTVAQVNAILPVFTSTLNGLAPLSGGGTSNFLRADGTWAAPGGTGTVTSVSVVSANGLAGTVATSTSTPAITLSTTITGILQGNGTAISAASTTGTGAVVLANSPTLVTPALGTPSSVVLTSATGLPLTTGVTGQLPIANGGTGQATKAAGFDALSPMTTGGDLIYGGASGTGTRLANGTSGQHLISSGGTAAPTWQNVPGVYYVSAYYPSSNANFWSSTSATSANFTTNGTIPAPTILVSSNFGTISNATSSLPGINFSAPRTGVIKVTAQITGVAASTGTNNYQIVLQESTTATTISLMGGTNNGTATNNTDFNFTMVGYLPVTSATTYNIKLTGSISTGTLNVGGQTAGVATSTLTFNLNYIT